MPAQYVNNEPEFKLKTRPADTKPLQDTTQDEQWLISFDDNTMTTETASSSSSSDEEDEHESAKWYSRNDTALKDPREMRKLILGQSRVGLDIVQALQSSTASKKKVDVTGKRRERKSVLPQNVWGEVQQQLKDEGIELVNREKGGAAEGRTRATLTYYGTSAMFYNHQVKTKIRMRIRYYLSYVRQADGEITDVQREGATQTNGFLELKVKSPRAFEENSVDKYRLLVPDALISKLVNLDATQDTFLNELELVKEEIQSQNPEKKTLIETMFGILGKLAQRKSAFIRPSLVISYERSAYKYVEKDYPIPVKETNSKKRSRSQVQSSKKTSKKLPRLAKVFPWRRRKNRTQPVDNKPDGSETSITEGHHDEVASLTSHTTADTDASVEHHDIEYQFTIDRNVRAHYPLLPLAGAVHMPIAEHFDVANRTELMSYPTQARVIEFKEPLVVAELPNKDRSDDHNTLINVLVSKMESLIMWGDYDENIGKYGNLRSRLMQEHKTNRIKNEQIKIDFTGTGEYREQHFVDVPTNLEFRE